MLIGIESVLVWKIMSDISKMTMYDYDDDNAIIKLQRINSIIERIGIKVIPPVKKQYTGNLLITSLLPWQQN